MAGEAQRAAIFAEEAAEILEKEDGISVEIVDPRTLRPLDSATLSASLEKTNRLLVLEEGPRTGGWAAEIVATAAEESIVGVHVALPLFDRGRPERARGGGTGRRAVDSALRDRAREPPVSRPRPHAAGRSSARARPAGR